MDWWSSIQRKIPENVSQDGVHIYMTILSVLTPSQPFNSSKFDLPRWYGDIVKNNLECKRWWQNRSFGGIRTWIIRYVVNIAIGPKRPSRIGDARQQMSRSGRHPRRIATVLVNWRMWFDMNLKWFNAKIRSVSFVLCEVAIWSSRYVDFRIRRT